MNTLRDFLTLSNYTRKHGSKGEENFTQNYLMPTLDALLVNLGLDPFEAINTDGAGNIWVELASPEKAPYLFAAHIDTCHSEEDVMMNLWTCKQSNFVFNHPTTPYTCCGFDDGVGIFVNLNMIKAGVEGTYLFTRGEERGLIGANFIVEQHQDKLEQFKLCVEVDRRGKEEVIVSQMYGPSASEHFGTALADALKMGHKASHEGVYTDNAVFAEFIPECVNLAAGYYHQHTAKECVDFKYVSTLVDQMIKVKWGELPILRKPEPEADLLKDYYRDADAGYTFYDYEREPLTYDQLMDIINNEPETVAELLLAWQTTSSDLYGG